MSLRVREGTGELLRELPLLTGELLMRETCMRDMVDELK